MIMDPNVRKFIEAIKGADNISMTVDVGKDSFDINLARNKRLYHDIALAIQTAVREKGKQNMKSYG